MSFSDTSHMICMTCISLNELCPDCMESRQTFDAEIAHDIVDDRNLVYPSIWSINKGLPSSHDWIAPETRNADGSIRSEFAPQTVDMADRFFNLEDSISHINCYGGKFCPDRAIRISGF